MSKGSSVNLDIHKSYCSRCVLESKPEMLSGYSLKGFKCDKCGSVTDLAMVRIKQESEDKAIEKLRWKQADVGCYWNAGEFSVCTISSPDKNGYLLTRNKEELGVFQSLLLAQRFANDLYSEIGGVK